ncbi:hypothetical protein AX15_005448 [Amanita polypyramis BW_CC]|nr:hypothetical protein AX15_005448 [Amanita polypyramis BW_CC]
MENGHFRESVGMRQDSESKHTSLKSAEPLADDKHLNMNDSVSGQPRTDEPEDGSLRGWMTVVGCWFTLFSTQGYVYSFGVYQDYYTRVFLRQSSPSRISWMGSAQLAIPFAVGIVAGKLFDAGHIRSVMIFGSVLFTICLFMLSLAHEGQFYQVFLSQGLGMGLGTGFVFTPVSAIVSLHFKKRRGLAYGIVLTGVSLGSTVFPIILNHLIPRIGFGPGVRVTAYIVLGCLTIGNALVRIPARKQSSKAPPPDIREFFRDPAYVSFVSGSAIALLGTYFPVIYLQLYSVQHNVDKNLAFYSVAILNGTSTFGRIVGNLLADMYGIWNIQIPALLATGAMIWAVLGVSNAASLVVVSVLYGITSGAWFSLSIAGLASLATSPKEIGARTGLGLAIVSPALLCSAPLQGALVTRNFKWVRAIAFSGAITMFSSVFYLYTRSYISRRKQSQKI